MELSQKEKLHEEWKYDFEAWKKVAGFDPVELIKSVDLSESYEMTKASIFKNESGNYAFVTESGCSCYDPSSACIDFFPVLGDAMNALSKWEKENTRNY